MSRDDANDLMWDAFGDGGWWDAHPVDDMTPEDQASLFAPPYFRIPWPTPPLGGETVTLRVRITLPQSRESSLWIAGRCLLHRPGASDTEVSFGAGVRTEVAEERQIFRMRGAPRIGGAGVVLRVRFFRREDAERAVAADPENVSIVEGSVTHGAFRMPRKVHEGEPEVSRKEISISGTFSVNELCEIANLVRSFSPVYREVNEELEKMGVPEEAVFGVEIERNRIVAIHVKAEGGVLMPLSEEPRAMPHQVIEYLRVEGGTFSPLFDLDFHPGHNDLIGEFGTGKSGVLHLVTYALDAHFELPDPDEHEEYVRETLGAGRVEVGIRTRHGVRYKLARAYGEPPIVYGADGSPADVPLDGNLFKLHAYGAGSLVEIARNPGKQLALIDAFAEAEIRRLGEEIAHVERDLGQSAVERRRLEMESRKTRGGRASSSRSARRSRGWSSPPGGKNPEETAKAPGGRSRAGGSGRR